MATCQRQVPVIFSSLNYMKQWLGAGLLQISRFLESGIAGMRQLHRELHYFWQMPFYGIDNDDDDD